MSTTVTIGVAGMTCQGCVRSITRALLSLPGVTQAEVSLEKARAEVTYDEALIQREGLVQAIADAGFEPRP